MKQFKVIKLKNYSTKMPIQSTVITWLFMDRLHASTIAYCIVGFLYFIIWISCIVRLALQTEVDLFPENEPVKETKTWAQRLEELKNREK